MLSIRSFKNRFDEYSERFFAPPFFCVCCECSGNKPDHVLIQIHHETKNILPGSHIFKKLIYFQCFKYDVYYKCILKYLISPLVAGTKIILPSKKFDEILIKHRINSYTVVFFFATYHIMRVK